MLFLARFTLKGQYESNPTKPEKQKSYLSVRFTLSLSFPIVTHHFPPSVMQLLDLIDGWWKVEDADD
jgi:hypothetical protein